MATIRVYDRQGSLSPLQTEQEISLMELIRDSGIDDLIGLCGGCCSCATCHVHVESSWLRSLPTMSQEEDDLLDTSDHRQPESRLACQIPLRDHLDGLVVSMAPED